MNKYHYNKNGVKRPSSWSDTPFWPISLREISKRGAKKVDNQPSPNLFFKTQDDLVIMEVILSCFGMKRGPVWGVVACYVEKKRKAYTKRDNPSSVN